MTDPKNQPEQPTVDAKGPTTAPDGEAKTENVRDEIADAQNKSTAVE